MEFNTNKRDALDEAVKPRAIKAQTQNWTLLEGYVYVISKKMPIRQNGKMLNCVKIGMSNLNTREGFDKSYTRLLKHTFAQLWSATTYTAYTSSLQTITTQMMMNRWDCRHTTLSKPYTNLLITSSNPNNCASSFPTAARASGGMSRRR